LDIYNTYYLLAAIESITPEQTFFKQRYFPTNPSFDVFGTSKVLIDFREEGQKMAPFVLPRIGSLSVGRESFSTYELEPPFIAPSLPLTLDQLKKRGFGESLMSALTPEDRARMLQIKDLEDLDKMITRREEWMAVQTILDNGCTMCHQTDKKDVYEDVEVKFYDGEDNPALFTPAAPWTHTKMNADGTMTIGNWYRDVASMIKMLTSRGKAARDWVVASDIGDFLLEDLWIQKMLDNRNVSMGRIAPTELTDYVTELGVFTINGHRLSIIVNEEEFEVDNKSVPAMPAGSTFITAPGCGKGLYGAHTQLENDGEPHTYAGTRIPQHIFTVRPPVKETVLTARPLMVPLTPSPWVVAKSVFE
jgi:hypothetical protein